MPASQRCRIRDQKGKGYTGEARMYRERTGTGFHGQKNGRAIIPLPHFDHHGRNVVAAGNLFALLAGIFTAPRRNIRSTKMADVAHEYRGSN